MDWIIVLLVYAAFIYGVYKLAKSKNRDPGGWMLASIIISPIIILVILAIMQKLPETKKRVNKRKIVSKKIK
jgi:heme/copper-type cytochrome/quinol oxidase subunit 2